MFGDTSITKSFIQITGQECIKILNYRKILQYNENEIILLIESKKTHIKGLKLSITYFDEDEMTIQGCIKSIHF